MFRTLIYPSSGPCHYSVESPHWSYCSWFDVCWSFGVAGLEWYLCSRLKPSACYTDTTPTQPHRNSNTHRTKNNTTNVVTQQHSRKLLMMDILMSETCCPHKKWNKITNDIKFVFCFQLLGWSLFQWHFVHHKYYMERSDIDTRPSRSEFGFQRPEWRREQE